MIRIHLSFRAAVLIASWLPSIGGAAQITPPDSNSAASPGLPVQTSTALPLSKATFHIYVPPYAAKRVYTDIGQATARTPEELMQSMASETTQEWVDSNWMKHISNRVSPEAFKVRKERDPEKNYYELIHKLTFSYDGVETAIVKYWFVDDGKRTIVTAMQMQKIGDRWLGAAVPGIEHIASLVAKLKPEVLAALFPMRPPQSELIREILSQTRDPSGGLDFTKLHVYLTMLAEKKDYDTLLKLLDRSSG